MCAPHIPFFPEPRMAVHRSNDPSLLLSHPTSPNLPLHIHLTLNLHLNSPTADIRRRLKRLDRLLQIKPMRNQPSHIHNPTLHEPDSTGPGIRIAVLKLQIDLLGTEAHKRETHLRFPDTDDEDLAPELDAPDRGVDAAFDAGALEGDGRADAAGLGDDGSGGVLGGDAALDLVGADAGAEGLGEGEAGRFDVGDDDGFSAGGGDAEEGDEADGAGAADEDGVAEGDFGAFDSGEGDAEGLEEGAVFEGHGADFVAPHCGVVDVAAEEAVDGGGGEEAHGKTAVVAACEAGFAFAADKVGFDGDAVAGFEGGDGRVGGEDYAGGFVAEDVVVFDDHGADAAGVPEVNVGSGGD